MSLYYKYKNIKNEKYNKLKRTKNETKICRIKFLTD